MKTILDSESLRKSSIINGFLLIIVIGLLDFATGYEYAFSVFYILPIALVTWYSTPKISFFACVVSAIVWFWADKSAGRSYSFFLIPYWNTLIRFSFFVIIAYLLFTLKSALQREKDLSLTDYLTGASNSRHFYEIVQMEINRLERSKSPFTIAYLDIDNFKTINDTFGHPEGDLVLKTIVSSLKSKIRSSDLVARLGGDELALFFPDTNQESARVIWSKIHDVLKNEISKNNWIATFSIGVVTCTIAPSDINDLIKTADELMYSVKRHGKNMVKYSVYETKNLAKQKTG
ncbi:MAG: GGDEF domain-containing protein [Anaerolineales bacterium]|nr:GGDEF domain-containing protein [Anaerolineales bacterium]